MDFSNKQINHAIIKAISIFEITKKRDFETTLVKNNYSNSEINEESEKFFKNYFYPEFRHLLFSNIKTESVKTYTKKIDSHFTFMLQNENGEFFRHTKIKVNHCDLFLFPVGIHFFSIDFSLENTTFIDVSNINFFVQKLDRNVFIMNDKNETFQWIDWIELNCLNSIKILPKNPTDYVSVDAYSGSKFKIYNVIETTEELSQKNRLHLLYDLGCNARIGSAEGNGKDSPSDSYLNELLENKISVFQNYDILPLFDSFTVIGHSLFNPTKPDKSLDVSYTTWSDTYLRIVLYNLFLKFNLFKYNVEAKEDSVKTREKFESFINHYNFSHISYNFLPNLFVKKYRKSLEIDIELDLFQKRINRISQSIQEKQQNKINSLITIVTILSSLGSISPILNGLKYAQQYLNWNPYIFYSIISVSTVFIVIVLGKYLFPTEFKKIIKSFRSKLIKTQK